VLGKFLGNHTPTGTGTHHDRVDMFHLHGCQLSCL
jgi:hypothetical protein